MSAKCLGVSMILQIICPLLKKIHATPAQTRLGIIFYAMTRHKKQMFIEYATLF